MPRRRTVKAKPTAPKTELDLPGLTVTSDMTRKEKEEQLAIFKKDFDYKVANTLKAIENEAEHVKIRIRNHFATQLQKIPVALQDMTLREFAAAGGTIEAALKYKQERNKDKIIMELENRYGTSSVLKPDLPSIEEESLDEQTEQKMTSVMKTTKSKKQMAAPSTVMGPPIRKSVRASKSRYATPAGRGMIGAWGSTPAITPKFDPRLPATPENIREMKPGERIMSMAGSPLKVESLQGATPQPAMNDMFGHFFSSHFGVDLTPTRVERALRVGGLLK